MFNTPLKALIFDFDGTLVESVGIKDAAFEKLFKIFPDKLDKIMTYHLMHNHTVRFIKFRHIYENILHLEYTNEDKKRLSKDFSELVYRQIVDSPYVPGTMELLSHCHGVIPMYLVTKSPPEELERILKARKLDVFFDRIYPSTWEKYDAIMDILSKAGLSVEQAVYIGDAPEDKQVSDKAGIGFIGRDSGKELTGELVSDMFGVLEIIQTQSH